MHKIIIIILTFLSLDVFSQVEITWQTLSNVEFEDQYIESEDVYYYYPFFIYSGLFLFSEIDNLVKNK